MENTNKSKLNEEILKILNDGLVNGFKDSYLDLRSKDINDDMMDEICEWIVKLEGKIKILNLGHNNITSKGGIYLFDNLNKHKSAISQIYLNDNKINDECMESVGNYIKNNPHIEIIHLNNYYSDTNKISDKGIEILSPYLEGNKTFKQFIFCKNKGITNKSIPFLMKMIETSNIANINMDGTFISDKSMLVVPLVNNTLKCDYDKIDFRNKSLTDENIIGICEGMKKYDCDKLKEMDLTRNKITSKGAMMLFETLKEMKSKLINLFLDDNLLDDECMEMFGEFIEYSETIEYIGIPKNKITDKGIEILSENLIGNISLITLNISGNKGITDKSLPNLIDVAKKTSITSIDLRWASISEKSKTEINKLVKIPIDEREIPIKSSSKSAAKIS